MSVSVRDVFARPQRCSAVRGCGCSLCSYADGYEDARREAMGAHLGTIDFVSSVRPPRRTPTNRALRQLAEALDRLGADVFGAEDWREFKAEVRRTVKEQAN